MQDSALIYAPSVETSADVLMDTDDQVYAASWCCVCGISIPPNPTNTCLICLKSKVDIAEGIMKQGILNHCRTCKRYNGPPWMNYELESN